MAARGVPWLLVVTTLGHSLLPVPCTATERPYPHETAIRADEIRRDVTFLASDATEGRQTAGGVLETLVTGYVEKEWKRLKLAPGGPSGTYRQPWRYRAWSELGVNRLHSGVGRAPTSRDRTARPPEEFGVEPNQEGVAFDPGGRPVSVEPLPDLPTFAPEDPNTHNLIAKVPGASGAVSGEVIVVGGHMDHLGKSSYGSDDRIYNGADDNASGTGAVIAIARALAQARDAGRGPSRTVLLILFSGEEKGLLGSQYFVGRPTVPIGAIKGMVNLDMVGRASAQQVSCGDRGAPGGPNLFHELHDSAGLGFATLDHNIDQYMRSSDQYSFMKKDVPVIFFFEGYESNGGLNPDYHRVTDTADKLDFGKLERIARLAFRHLMAAANHP